LILIDRDFQWFQNADGEGCTNPQNRAGDRGEGFHDRRDNLMIPARTLGLMGTGLASRSHNKKTLRHEHGVKAFFEVKLFYHTSRQNEVRR
jgi:hypothetical protein